MVVILDGSRSEKAVDELDPGRDAVLDAAIGSDVANVENGSALLDMGV